MKRSGLVMLAIVAALGVHACAQLPGDLAQLGGWTTLIDGRESADAIAFVAEEFKALTGAAPVRRSS